MIVHWGDDGLLIVFCRDGPRDDGEEGGRPQTDQCSGLQVQRTGPLTAGWGWWPRVIVYSVLFRNCMWIYSAVMSHIRFISLLADCNPLISYTCISEVAFEVRSSLFNCYMVVQESWFVDSWQPLCWTLYTAVRRKTKWPHSCPLYCTMCSHTSETTGKLWVIKRFGNYLCLS